MAIANIIEYSAFRLPSLVTVVPNTNYAVFIVFVALSSCSATQPASIGLCGPLSAHVGRPRRVSDRLLNSKGRGSCGQCGLGQVAVGGPGRGLCRQARLHEGFER